MKILVTGGLGFVGSHFVWAASDRGDSIAVLDDRSGGGNPPLPAAIEPIIGDVGDVELLGRTFADFEPDAVVHFAGKIQVGESTREPAMYFDSNLVRPLRLLECMVQHDVRRIVFSSTAAVYGEPEMLPIVEHARTEPTSPYGAAKLAFEFVLRGFEAAHGMCWAAPRYFNAAGAHPNGKLVEAHDPETHLIPLVIDAGLGRRGPLTIFGEDYDTPDGTAIRDYVHVCDLVAAHLLALDRMAQGVSLGPFNLGGGVGSSVREVMTVTQELLGRPVPHSVGARRAGDPTRLIADPTAAQKRLGWKPERSDLHTLIEDCIRSRTQT